MSTIETDITMTENEYKQRTETRTLDERLGRIESIIAGLKKSVAGIYDGIIDVREKTSDIYDTLNAQQDRMSYEEGLDFLNE